MDELETGLLLATAVGVVSLTVAILGLLRRVTDLRLMLAGHTDVPRASLRLSAGLTIPPLDDGALDGDALLVFASSDCEACAALLGELGRIQSGPILVVPADGAGDRLAPLVPDGISIVDDEAARRLVDELAIDQIPLVLAQRDGIILGHASGESAASARLLESFWATLGVRPVQEVPS